MIEIERGFRQGDLLNVQIEGLDRDGVGTARLRVHLKPQKEDRSYTVRVPQSVPGDELAVEVTSVRRRDVFAKINAIQTPSALRVKPPCQHILETPPCGGCTLQMVDYRHQLMLKERGIKEAMSRHGIDPGLVLPPRPSPHEWRYRNKMEFSFSPGPNPQIGLRPAGYKFDVVDQKTCLLFGEWAMGVLELVKGWAAQHGFEGYHFKRGTGHLRALMVREGKRSGQRLVELMAASPRDKNDGMEEAFEALAHKLVHEHGVDGAHLSEHFVQRGSPSVVTPLIQVGQLTFRDSMRIEGPSTVRELEFDVGPRDFFQPNPAQAEKIYSHVVGMVQEYSSVLDLYCGTGTIGLAMAPFVDRVRGIELVPTAIENARKNAELNGIENAEFMAGDVAEILPQLDTSDVECIVVDPPRAGLHPDALRLIDFSKARALVYVSCNPDSLGRDLKVLSRGWTIGDIQPFDMFPHTNHVENVVLCTRGG